MWDAPRGPQTRLRDSRRILVQEAKEYKRQERSMRLMAHAPPTPFVCYTMFLLFLASCTKMLTTAWFTRWPLRNSCFFEFRKEKKSLSTLLFSFTSVPPFLNRYCSSSLFFFVAIIRKILPPKYLLQLRL